MIEKEEKEKERPRAVMYLSPVKLLKNTNSTNLDSPEVGDFFKTPLMVLNLPATCGECYDTRALKVCLERWREGCKQVAESRNVLEVLRFILNIRVNASSDRIAVFVFM